MIWLVLFVIFNCVNGVMMSSLGYSVDTWQYWVSTVCVCGSYIVGRFYDINR